METGNEKTPKVPSKDNKGDRGGAVDFERVVRSQKRFLGVFVHVERY